MKLRVLVSEIPSGNVVHSDEGTALRIGALENPAKAALDRSCLGA